MTYALYYSPGTASLALHWMLIELGEPFDLVLTDTQTGAQRSPEYLKLNPAGRVPTLVVDGKPHAEVAAMLMLVAERDPARRFDVAPARRSGRTTCNGWSSSLTRCSPPSAPGSIRTNRRDLSMSRR